MNLLLSLHFLIWFSFEITSMQAELCSVYLYKVSMYCTCIVIILYCTNQVHIIGTTYSIVQRRIKTVCADESSKVTFFKLTQLPSCWVLLSLLVSLQITFFSYGLNSYCNILISHKCFLIIIFLVLQSTYKWLGARVPSGEP